MRKVKIKDIGIVVTGKTPTTKDETNFDGDILFITPADIAKGYIIEKSERTISQKGFDSISSNTIKGTSVLVGCIGSDMGNVAITELTCASNQQINSITSIREEYNPFYIYYNLSLRKSYLRQIAGTTTTPILPKSVFEEICIDFPDRTKQDNVVKICHALDEKIRLNNKINEELEKLAKTLYDYWFVQFDFSDENERPYKSSGGSMIYNEILKREIPANWKVENISKYCNIIDCLHSKKPDYCYEANNLYLLQLENLTNAGYIDITNRYYISKDDYKYWIQKIEIQENDFIFTNAGRTGAFGKIPKDVRCALGRNLTAIRPISISPYYLRMYFGSNDMRQQVLSNLDCGAFFKSFNVKSIKLIALLIPQENILNNFILKISPIIKQIETNNIETQFLIEVRDFLLPMLMNGQVTIRQ